MHELSVYGSGAFLPDPVDGGEPIERVSATCCTGGAKDGRKIRQERKPLESKSESESVYFIYFRGEHFVFTNAPCHDDRAENPVVKRAWGYF